MSAKKIHQDTAGYVAERESKHPGLPGHIVVLDAKKGGDWIDADTYRWIVAHAHGEQFKGFVTVQTRAMAFDLMRDTAAGGDQIDLGQHESLSEKWTREAQAN